MLHQADFTIPVDIEGSYHNVYVIKRPGVDEFMKRVGELYEVVVFTASVSKVCPAAQGLGFVVLIFVTVWGSIARPAGYPPCRPPSPFQGQLLQ